MQSFLKWVVCLFGITGQYNYKEVIALAASLSDKIHIATEGSNKGVAYALNSSMCLCP